MKTSPPTHWNHPLVNTHRNTVLQSSPTLCWPSGQEIIGAFIMKPTPSVPLLVTLLPPGCLRCITTGKEGVVLVTSCLCWVFLVVILILSCTTCGFGTGLIVVAFTLSFCLWLCFISFFFAFGFPSCFDLWLSDTFE